MAKPAGRLNQKRSNKVMADRVNLPENYRRIADSFDGLESGQKEAVIGHLMSAKDPNQLAEMADQIIANGGPEGELVARIFSKPFPGVDGESGVRTATSGKVVPEGQKEEAGTGAVHTGHAAKDSPHTSSANPPRPGHGRTPPVESEEGAGDPSGKQGSGVTGHTR